MPVKEINHNLFHNITDFNNSMLLHRHLHMKYFLSLIEKNDMKGGNNSNLGDDEREDKSETK